MCEGTFCSSVDETPTSLAYVAYSMSTSIRISEETKEKLEALKREGETFDELLDRLAVTRTPEDVEEMAGWANAGIEDHMADTNEELSESLEQNSRRE